jgi:hypothetical protein
MDRNNSKPNDNAKQECANNKETSQPNYYWVSYPDNPGEKKIKNSDQESILERSNRFAL